MPVYTRERLLADIEALKKLGDEALKSLEYEFADTHRWCLDALHYVRSEDFKHEMRSTSDSYPKTPKGNRSENNNDLNHTSLEQTNLRARKLQMLDEDEPSASPGIQRMPTRQSQRIIAKTRSLEDGNLHETSSSSINSVSSSSSTVHPTAGILKKSKPVLIKCASEKVMAPAKGAGTGSKKLVRGTPILSRPGAPLSRKVLKEAPIAPSGPKPAQKQPVKGTTPLSGPAPLSRKVLKEAPTAPAGPKPAQKQPIKGTTPLAGPAPLSRKVLKEAPTAPAGPKPTQKQPVKGTTPLAGSQTAPKKLLIGTPTSSRAGAISKLKGTAAANPKSAVPQGGQLSKLDYVKQVAQVGLSHLGKVKMDAKPDCSSIKQVPLVQGSRETFVITPCEPGQPKPQEGFSFSQAAGLGVKATHDDAHCALVKDKALRETFVIDKANSTFVIDKANSTFVIDSNDKANATFVMDSSDKANATFAISSSDIILNSQKKVLQGLQNLAIHQDEDLGKSGVAHCLNTTFPVVKDPNATFEIASYDVTLDPDERAPLPSKNKDDYGLDDVCSDDSSDDESNPKKVVPEWAQAVYRQSHLQMQHEVTTPQMFAFFESVESTPDLTKMFTANIDRRMLIRRSSAVWLPLKEK